MKYFPFFFMLLAFSLVNAQILPIDFEAEESPFEFVDFDGGIATIEANPNQNIDNMSTKVGKIVRNGGEIYAGSSITLAENLDFTTNNSISMKVFTTAPIGTVVKFKLEGNGTTERDVVTTVSNEWEDLTWDFTGEPANFNKLVFMFDFGNVGDGSINSTFYFDEIYQNYGGAQIDLPVDFEDETVNYTMSDFGGNVSSFVQDPSNKNNNVIKVVKTNQSALWAGTTIGTPAGFASNIPLSLTDSKMTVRVWSPSAGTPIRLKVEDSNDPTHTCETEVVTTVGGDWEYLVFDFTNEAPGTAALATGMDMGWTYNMASIFFNFGTKGEIAGEQTYYFDDVQFGEFVVGTQFINASAFDVFPNPSTDLWTINAGNKFIQSFELFNAQGQLILVQKLNEASLQVDASRLASGIYFSKVNTDEGVSVLKLIRD